MQMQHRPHFPPKSSTETNRLLVSLIGAENKLHQAGRDHIQLNHLLQWMDVGWKCLNSLMECNLTEKQGNV